MTERDWQTCTDALAMLDQVFPFRGVESVEPHSRKSRLYLIACGRRARAELPGVCRVVVGLAERIYRDPASTDRTLRDVVELHAESLVNCRGEADDVNAIGRALVDLGYATAAEVWAADDADPGAWTGYAHLAYFPFSRTLPFFRRIPARLHSADLLRELFGNPFARLPALREEWMTDNVVRLAKQANMALDFAVMPILADALQDAGCDRDDVLNHLRDTAVTHARGCWVLEQILDRK